MEVDRCGGNLFKLRHVFSCNNLVVDGARLAIAVLAAAVSGLAVDFGVIVRVAVRTKAIEHPASAFAELLHLFVCLGGPLVCRVGDLFPNLLPFPLLGHLCCFRGIQLHVHLKVMPQILKNELAVAVRVEKVERGGGDVLQAHNISARHLCPNVDHHKKVAIFTFFVAPGQSIARQRHGDARDSNVPFGCNFTLGCF